MGVVIAFSRSCNLRRCGWISCYAFAWRPIWFVSIVMEVVSYGAFAVVQNARDSENDSLTQIPRRRRRG